MGRLKKGESKGSWTKYSKMKSIDELKETLAIKYGKKYAGVSPESFEAVRVMAEKHYYLKERRTEVEKYYTKEINRLKREKERSLLGIDSDILNFESAIKQLIGLSAYHTLRRLTVEKFEKEKEDAQEGVEKSEVKPEAKEESKPEKESSEEVESQEEQVVEDEEPKTINSQTNIDEDDGENQESSEVKQENEYKPTTQ